jgi:hypothetical protein
MAFAGAGSTDQHGGRVGRQRLQASPEPFSSAVLTPRLFLLGEFGEIPVEVDHDLANLVLPAYRLSEPGEMPGSTLPANRSQ